MRKKRAPRVCVLISGGFDSAILAADYLRRGYEVHPLYVQSGFYWERVELLWLKKVLKALKRPTLMPLTVVRSPVSPLLKRHWGLDGRGVPAASDAWDSVFLPGRNLLLLGQAALFSSQRGIPLVAQGLLKGNPFDDATPRFRRLMQRTINAGLDKRIKLVAPFARLTKDQVMRRAGGLPLELTFSCLKPRGSRHCGVCSKCYERERCLGKA